MERPLALTQVTVIDGTGSAPIGDATVLVERGRIAAVGPSSSVDVPDAATVVYGGGRFVIPGLWDMHGHLTYATEHCLGQLIRNGVTGVRDLGGDLVQLDRWRGEIDRGERVGPHIVRAGPFLDGPKPGLADRVTVQSPEEARRAVRTWVAAGVDFLKVHNGMDRSSFFALLEESRAAGVPVAVHLPHGVSSVEASDAGAASLEHVETLHESALYGPGASASSVEEAAAQNLGPGGDDVLRRLARNRTWYVPTLVAYERGFALWTEDPEALGPRMQIHRQNIELVAHMRRAGVPLLAGSDFSDWGAVAGVDLHNELALLVESGMSSMEALQAATLRPAEFLGKTDDFGTVRPGRVADLVLLDADPLRNISHTRKIHAVVRGGRYLPIAESRLEERDVA